MLDEFIDTKTDSYEILRSLVESKRLKIIYIFSIPRSTALEKALAQMPSVDGQFNEPFYITSMEPVPYDYDPAISTLEIRPFQKGYDHILSLYQQFKTEERNNPIILVLKDHTSVFNQTHFKKILTLTNNILFTIRDPKQLCMSLLLCTTRNFVTPSGSEMTHEEALHLVNTMHTDLFIDEELNPSLARQNKIH